MPRFNQVHLKKKKMIYSKDNFPKTILEIRGSG